MIDMQVLNFMKRQIRVERDSFTVDGEFDYIYLAELAADKFNLYLSPGMDIPSTIIDMAKKAVSEVNGS